MSGFKCPYCNAKFDHAQKLTEHVNWVEWKGALILKLVKQRVSEFE